MKIKVILICCAWIGSMEASEAAQSTETFRVWSKQVTDAIAALATRQEQIDTVQREQAEALKQLNENQAELLAALNETRTAVSTWENIKAPVRSKVQECVVYGTCAAVMSYLAWQKMMADSCCPVR